MTPSQKRIFTSLLRIGFFLMLLLSLRFFSGFSLTAASETSIKEIPTLVESIGQGLYELSDHFKPTRKIISKLSIFKGLLSYLAESLSNEEKIRALKLYLTEQIEFKSNLFYLNVANQYVTPDYSFQYKPEALNRGKAFYKANQALFDGVSQATSVPASVILGILKFETNFGEGTGVYNVLYTYTAMSFMDDPSLKPVLVKEMLKDYPLFAKDRPGQSYSDFAGYLKKRLRRKAIFGMEQVKACFQMESKLPYPLEELKGSFAGAFGFPQFIPSSYLSYAVDGDQSGSVDLYHWPDVIASIGNYLNKFDFEKSPWDAVWGYNHSTAYANGVLTYAMKLGIDRFRTQLRQRP